MREPAIEGPLRCPESSSDLVARFSICKSLVGGGLLRDPAMLDAPVRRFSPRYKHSDESSPPIHEMEYENHEVHTHSPQAPLMYCDLSARDGSQDEVSAESQTSQ